MPFINPPWAIDETPYTAQSFRQAAVSAFAHDTDPAAPRSGVLSGFDADVDDLDVTLHPGQAIVSPVGGASGGYLSASPTDVKVTLEARDTAFTRWDVIGLRIYDTAIDGSGKRGAAIEVYTGTPSATPADPELPAGVLPLKRAVVPPAGEVAIVSLHPWTAARGGVIACPDGNLPAVSVAQPGQLAYTDRLVVWDGNSWEPVVPPSGHIGGGKDGGGNLPTGENIDVTSWIIDSNPVGATYDNPDFVVQRPGVWLINGAFHYAEAIASGYRMFWATVNGAKIAESQTALEAGAQGGVTLTVSRAVRLSAGDRVRFGVRHGSGVTETFVGDPETTCDLSWLGA